jgi:hypothetical protein
MFALQRISEFKPPAGSSVKTLLQIPKRNGCLFMGFFMSWIVIDNPQKLFGVENSIQYPRNSNHPPT